MSDLTPPKPSLTEISHLFLSSVREKQTNGSPLPRRIAPGQPRLPDGDSAAKSRVPGDKLKSAHALASEPVRRTPPVTAVLGAHLNGKQIDFVKDYARHMAALHGRIGLIEVDASEFRLVSFEAGGEIAFDLEQTDPGSAERFDTREMTEALEEMNWDVDRWLVLLPNPRAPKPAHYLKPSITGRCSAPATTMASSPATGFLRDWLNRIARLFHFRFSIQ